ncbi:Signal transduction histidine kinase [Candidatus Magnetoovum chiemensis]|nr:Signal transduction histidine kinase [Candidatus Magnetoovum chiemensis]
MLMVFLKLQNRILVLFLSLFVIVLTVIFLLVDTASKGFARKKIENDLITTTKVFDRMLKIRIDQLTEGVRILSSDYGFKQAIASSDKPTMLSALKNHSARINASIAMVISMDSRLVVNTLTDEGALDFDFSKLIERAQENGEVTDAVLINKNAYELIIVPLLAPDPVSWVAMGFAIDNTMADDLKNLTLCDISFLQRGSDNLWNITASSLTQDVQLKVSNLFKEPSFNVQTGFFQFKKDEIISYLMPLNENKTIVSVIQKPLKETVSSYYDQLRNTILAVSFLGLLMVVLFGMFIARGISQPLKELVLGVQDIGKGNYGKTVTVKTKDEIGLLAQSFSEMSLNLKASYEELAQYNRMLEQRVAERTAELKNAYDELKESQNKLIQSEKMASLGQLVAGVAHELNTPIGNALTASSHFQEQTKEIAQAVENKTIKKSSLSQYFDEADKITEIITKNLHRTGELIRSFKLVSADQTSLERRVFNLKNYLDDILISLKPNIKKTKHAVNINCPDNIELDSYPGALAQVMTNLIMNSIIHGYEEKDEGAISIDAALTSSETITIKQSDNGKGINEQDIKKIFDPFFTTKRGKGGTGLGLHIVYNSVTSALSGNILCESKLGKGTAFIITIPKTSSFQENKGG